MNFKKGLYSAMGLLLLLGSCRNKSDHPQAGIINQSTTTGLNEQAVIEFAEDIEHSKDNLKNLSSLVYKTGQENFFVEKYFNDHGDQVLIAHRQTLPALAESSRRYYFRNDSLILVTSSSSQQEANDTVFEESRTYLRNYTVFKREVKHASTAEELNTAAFETLDAKADEDFEASLRQLQDALEGRNDYELVFDGIVQYPDASFITLKSRNPNGYTAQVELKDKDAFVDSLQRDPSRFKSSKINFNWKIENMQAVYVPSGSTSTSASGLKR